jgi:hypothetical protein
MISMESNTDQKQSPIQPRHLHLVEYKPSNIYKNKLDKQTLLDQLLTNKYSIEFKYIIIAKEDISLYEPCQTNIKFRFLLNLKKKCKRPLIIKLFKDVIHEAQSEPIRDINNEIVIKSVKTQIVAISSITKYDMNFLHTGIYLNPCNFNIRYKVHEWCQKNTHLDIKSDEVQKFINKNKHKLNLETIVRAFETAKARVNDLNNDSPVEILNIDTNDRSTFEINELNHFSDAVLGVLEDGNVEQNFPQNIDFFTFLEPELLQWIETGEFI